MHYQVDKEKNIVCENAKCAGNTIAILLVILYRSFERIPDCLCECCPQLFEVISKTIQVATVWQTSLENEELVRNLINVGIGSPLRFFQNVSSYSSLFQNGVCLLHEIIPYQLDTAEIYNKEQLFEGTVQLLYQLMTRVQSRYLSICMTSWRLSGWY